MKIAVTAASGNLGSTIVRKLLPKAGRENVVGIARTPENALHLGIEIRKGDYDHREEFDEALQGIDTMILITGMDHPDQRIVQHRNVIGAAKKCKVRKIVFSSIVGEDDKTSFSQLLESYRQTEDDLKNCGLQWVIGRNGLYIEPDLEFIRQYIKDGAIVNCANDGKCAYTSRDELAEAHVELLLNDRFNKNIYNLVGKPVTQTDLAEAINLIYETSLKYQSVSCEEFKKQRQAELGEFLGNIVAGIYDGINLGYYDVNSDYEAVTGRKHKSLEEMIFQFKQRQES